MCCEEHMAFFHMLGMLSISSLERLRKLIDGNEYISDGELPQKTEACTPQTKDH